MRVFMLAAIAMTMSPVMILPAASSSAMQVTQPLIIYGNDLAPNESVILQVSNVGGKLVATPLSNIVGLDGQPIGGGSKPPVVPGDTAISKVAAAFAAIDKMDVFNQQLVVLKSSLVVPSSLNTRSLAFNYINSTLEVVLDEYASPAWSPWLDPFVIAMGDEQELEAFVAIVDQARASLSVD
jgi:hypothetical protein